MITMNVVGKGKFENRYICNRNKNVIDESCESIPVELEVQLNGGETTQTFKKIYNSGEEITLEIPTREGYVFIGWEVVKGNSIIEDNVLKIGRERTILYAMWSNEILLTVDLDEGHTTQDFKEKYFYGIVLKIETPTKEGYTFTGWTVTSGLNTTTARYGTSSLSVTSTMISSTKITAKYFKYLTATNDETVTLTANWTLNTPVGSYTCANTSAGSGTKVLIYTGNCTFINDGSNNWRIKFLTGGTLTLTKSLNTDVFLVGRGCAGAKGGSGIIIIRNAR